MLFLEMRRGKIYVSDLQAYGRKIVELHGAVSFSSFSEDAVEGDSVELIVKPVLLLLTVA
jgi:hypothetical protein